MKSAIIVILMLISVSVFSQPVQLPAKSIVKPYALPVSFNHTTVLVFPAPVKDGDRGDKNILATRQTGVDNVLKVKAARKGFDTTNLHVFTSDGQLYSFEVFYSESITDNTYNLNTYNLKSTNYGAAPLILADLVESNENIQTNALIVKNSRPQFHLTKRKFNMKLALRSIHYSDDKLYFSYRITNRSNLPYIIDFCRMYISDTRKVKRTSSQEQEIIPLFKSKEAWVNGSSSIDVIIAVKKFTIPDGKKFKIEFFEKGGGRNINIALKNRHIFRAKSL
ncbi:conjugative transposon TraN protein [Chitinophaga niastensis]|uniref:Conjugative transposon TraN protein n=1 Tax=Chitinophaga niastensis TaxID=536980 RepID=A0A2P8H9B6_CHINA|nr:conjugative transposon protein TraN [Chitinophaga niastensis]PSL42815.1 conjugative transposon TraN protein [Chitinophaga niastensis]